MQSLRYKSKSLKRNKSFIGGANNLRLPPIPPKPKGPNWANLSSRRDNTSKYLPLPPKPKAPDWRNLEPVNPTSSNTFNISKTVVKLTPGDLEGRVPGKYNNSNDADKFDNPLFLRGHGTLVYKNNNNIPLAFKIPDNIDIVQYTFHGQNLVCYSGLEMERANEMGKDICRGITEAESTKSGNNYPNYFIFNDINEGVRFSSGIFDCKHENQAPIMLKGESSISSVCRFENQTPYGDKFMPSIINDDGHGNESEETWPNTIPYKTTLYDICNHLHNEYPRIKITLLLNICLGTDISPQYLKDPEHHYKIMSERIVPNSNPEYKGYGVKKTKNNKSKNNKSKKNKSKKNKEKGVEKKKPKKK